MTLTMRNAREDHAVLDVALDDVAKDQLQGCMQLPEETTAFGGVPDIAMIEHAEIDIETEYLAEIGGCIDVGGDQLGLAGDQIVKIQYQNANGVVNTQYIVNQDLLEVQETDQCFMEAVQERGGDVYEDASPCAMLEGRVMLLEL